MKAFDTDILTEILAGNPAYAKHIANALLAEQAVPIVAVEEIIRGRLNTIRQAEAAKARITIEQAYLLFEQTLDDIRELKILALTQQAEALLKEWRKKKIRGRRTICVSPRFAWSIRPRWSRAIAVTSRRFQDSWLNFGINSEKLTGRG